MRIEFHLGSDDRVLKLVVIISAQLGSYPIATGVYILNGNFMWHINYIPIVHVHTPYNLEYSQYVKF